MGIFPSNDVLCFARFVAVGCCGRYYEHFYICNGNGVYLLMVLLLIAFVQ